MPTTQQGGLRALGSLPGSGGNFTAGGYDKHFGRAVCFITINRNIYWWTSLSINMSVDVRENTDPCSPIKQYQVIREEQLQISVDSMIPGRNNTTASAFVHDLRPGVVVDQFFCNLLEEIFTTRPDGVTQANRYGGFIVEQSNVDISRDDFTTLKVELRSLGYGDGMEFQADTGATAGANGEYSEYDPSGVDPDFPS